MCLFSFFNNLVAILLEKARNTQNFQIALKKNGRWEDIPQEIIEIDLLSLLCISSKYLLPTKYIKHFTVFGFLT